MAAVPDAYRLLPSLGATRLMWSRDVRSERAYTAGLSLGALRPLRVGGQHSRGPRIARILTSAVPLASVLTLTQAEAAAGERSNLANLCLPAFAIGAQRVDECAVQNLHDGGVKVLVLAHQLQQFVDLNFPVRASPRWLSG